MANALQTKVDVTCDKLGITKLILTPVKMQW